ncbi:MAG: prepilin-type N-terminal cleavage/methylation domain-containing protein [Acidobacteria bacterium]|nr:prepilin-type N-terminal cleavage/methylation domain-containing protein [Acidobacteriota bacterium]
MTTNMVALPHCCPSRRRRTRGFSLIELLIVISIIMIIILFAVPQFKQHTIHVHEASAMATIDTVRKEEILYQSRFPTKGFACSMSALGPPPPGQPTTDTAAGLVDSTVAAGAKDGYNFSVQDCVTQPNTQTVISYQIIAVPAVVGGTGNNAFCSDESGPTKVDHSGNGQACVTSGSTQ